MCDMPHSYVWHASFICVIWLIHMCGMNHPSSVWHDWPSRVWHDSFAPWRWEWGIYCSHICDVICDATWSRACLEYSIYELTEAHIVAIYDITSVYTWCDGVMTHSYVWHDSFTRVTWLIRMCGMTHSHVCDMSDPHVQRHDSLSRQKWVTLTSQLSGADCMSRVALL